VEVAEANCRIVDYRVVIIRGHVLTLYVTLPFRERRGKCVGKKEGGFMEVAKEKLKVVFVCVENARRSQMAQGFAEKIGRGSLEVYSAGSRPAPQVE
jgi:hypothetical protein